MQRLKARTGLWLTACVDSWTYEGTTFGCPAPEPQCRLETPWQKPAALRSLLTPPSYLKQWVLTGHKIQCHPYCSAFFFLILT